MFLGLDIGGTKILTLLVAPDGEVLARSKKKLKGRDPESVLRRASKTIGEVLEEASVKLRAVKRVGIAVPSAVRDGHAILAPALGWRNVPVARLAREGLSRPVFIGNDVNLGVAAEHLLGGARGMDSVAGFFIGTGVGGALIQGGRLLSGKDGMAGELGHIVVVPEGRRCGCGNAGCLEAYASKTAFLARIKEAIFQRRRRSVMRRELDPETAMISSRQLVAAHRARDPLVREVLEEGMRLLGLAVAAVINILSPDRVVLGGGVIQAFGKPMVRQIRDFAAPYVFGDARRARSIVPSALGDDAVPLGAALLARAKGELLGWRS